jgi:hypothetical protein
MDKDDVDPQQFLPADLRKSWLLLPRGSIYQLLVFGIVLGACIVLSIAEPVFGVSDLE